MTDDASEAVAGDEVAANVPAVKATPAVAVRPTWAKGLSGKQRAFVEHWLGNGFNGTRAAIAAGYAPGCASVEASRLLANAKIAAATEKALGELGIARIAVLKEIANVAFGVASEVMEWSEDGVRVKPSSELTRDQAALVQSVEHETGEFGTRVKVRLHDKLVALTALAKALGLHRSDAKGLTINSGGGPIQVNISKEDAGVL